MRRLLSATLLTVLSALYLSAGAAAQGEEKKERKSRTDFSGTWKVKLVYRRGQ